MRKDNYQWYDLPTVVTTTCCALGFIAAIGVVGYQLVNWFKTGVWKSFDFISFLGEFSNWAKAPDDWIGLHKLIETVPLTVGLFLIGCLIGILSIYVKIITDDMVKRFKFKKK